jgi:hypothetical protein
MDTSKAWAMYARKDLPETPLVHRKKPESYLADPTLEASRLSTDRYSAWAFQRAAKAVAELPKRDRHSGQSVAKNASGAKIYTISLPGFTLAQAQALANTASRNFAFSYVSTASDEAFTRLLKLWLRYSDKPRSSVRETPVQIGANRWELRALSENSPIVNKWLGHLDTLKHAYSEDRVLRFVYKTDDTPKGVTHRVRFRSLYEFNDKLSFFRGDHAGRIRSYSLARCSQMMLETTAVKHLLPTLALELVVSYQFSKLFVRVVQLA